MKTVFGPNWLIDSSETIAKVRARERRPAQFCPTGDRPCNDIKPLPKMATKRKTARKKAPARRKASTRKKNQNVYYFGAGKCDGDGSMKALLGGKGANLAEMSSIGVPVPAGFTITTEVCTYYYDNGKKYPRTLDAEIEANITKVEKAMGKKFGDLQNP